MKKTQPTDSKISVNPKQGKPKESYLGTPELNCWKQKIKIKYKNSQRKEGILHVGEEK